MKSFIGSIKNTTLNVYAAARGTGKSTVFQKYTDFIKNHVIDDDPDQPDYIKQYYFKVDEPHRHLFPGEHEYYVSQVHVRHNLEFLGNMQILRIASRAWAIRESGTIEVIKDRYEGKTYTVTDPEELKRFRWIQLSAANI